MERLFRRKKQKGETVKNKKKNRRKQRRKVILILLAVLVLGLVVIFGLFRVRKLVISGNKQYKAEEIQEAIMQDGLCKNSLYLLWKFSDQAKVKESIPFLNGAEAKLRTPFEVQVTVKEKQQILQDVLGEFRENVQEKYQLSQMEDEQQVQHCIELIEYMNPILEQKILTNLEQNSMIERMDEVLEKAWSLEPEKISSVVYEKLCARLMEIPDYEKCGKWAQRSMEQYPGVLSSYTCQLKLFFSNGDKENFFRVMNELKASDITIDKETLELIRIFM